MRNFVLISSFWTVNFNLKFIFENVPELKLLPSIGRSVGRSLFLFSSLSHFMGLLCYVNAKHMTRRKRIGWFCRFFSLCFRVLQMYFKRSGKKLKFKCLRLIFSWWWYLNWFKCVRKAVLLTLIRCGYLISQKPAERCWLSKNLRSNHELESTITYTCERAAHTNTSSPWPTMTILISVSVALLQQIPFHWTN